MKFNHAIYGRFEVTEQVLLDLINSKPIQRLKGINQNGVQHLITKIQDFTRFDHSIGVMLLLRRFGASVEEQIAGLLHDVSHTAFSHVGDQVFDNLEHEFHETVKERIVIQSEIPEILEKHGFSVEKALNEKQFGLLERDLPDLCADRLDYSFESILQDLDFGQKKLQELVSS
ncbi:MAG: HD domain-containing protein, partial [Candidatus Diapherotrites archaeon]|nr:HD domain-containing protein [Candidatus Diapherotrites archaeon]